MPSLAPPSGVTVFYDSEDAGQSNRLSQYHLNKEAHYERGKPELRK
jgi:hypothetical protein